VYFLRLQLNFFNKHRYLKGRYELVAPAGAAEQVSAATSQEHPPCLPPELRRCKYGYRQLGAQRNRTTHCRAAG
jgi:hypothetical protein